MITLTTLSTQLNDQLFDASFSAVPEATRTEAIRQALGKINAAFAVAYMISGLDGSIDTSLPDSYASALLLGASSFVLDFSIRSRLVGYHDTPEVSEKLVPWASSMKEDFDVALNRLKVIDLQQSTDAPTFQLPDESTNYNPTFDNQPLP